MTITIQGRPDERTGTVGVFIRQTLSLMGLDSVALFDDNPDLSPIDSQIERLINENNEVIIRIIRIYSSGKTEDNDNNESDNTI